MNRSQRRAMARNADATAATLAACCLDYRGSMMRRVDRPVAVAALTRAFALMLKAGGQPVSIRLTEAEAEAIARPGSPNIPGAVAWLAVGLDTIGMATYVMQDVFCLDREKASAAARRSAMAQLVEACQVPGFPMPEVMGRA